jgi:4-hydroxyphenylpyruvate dioxygenase
MFQPFRDLEGLPAPAQRARAFDRLERKFDTMGELGTDLLLLCSSCSPQADGDRGRLLADLAEAGERAGRRGLQDRLRGAGLGAARARPPRCLGAGPRCRSSRAGAGARQLPFAVPQGIPSSSIGDIRADKLFLVQVADAPMLDEMDYLGWSRHFRCMPGQGEFPLDDWAEAIRRIGYQGYWSLEIFNDRFRAGLGQQCGAGRLSLAAAA